MQYDFWDEFDISYRLFSQFCNEEDWQNSLLTIRSMLKWENPPARTLLDIGGGTGHNTKHLLELLFAQSGARHIVSIVEPSKIAQQRITYNLLSVKDGGFLKRVYSSFGELGRGRFDGIILLHSSYYIEDFETVIEKLVNEHLEEDGVVLVLALSRHSPFFLGLQPLCENTAENIRALAQEFSWRVDSRAIPSRFILPEDINLNDETFCHLFKFIHGHCVGLTLDNFQSLLDKYLRTGTRYGVDLQDIIIEIRR